MAAARERSLLSSSPRLAALASAHRSLLGAEERAALPRIGGLPAPVSAPATGPGSTFTYLEIPTASGGEQATARLRVMVRDRRGEGGRQGKPGRPVRAIMDISLSRLGEVWSEVVLSGQQLSVRLELPDEERRDFVAARLPELVESLAARGLEAQATAQARRTDAPSLADEWIPAEGQPGGLDLWA